MENVTQKKIGTLSLCGIYMAYFCSITAVPTGGLVGEGTTFLTGLWGIILGFAIGAVMIALSTWIGYRTGLQKDALWKQIFGRQGFRICSFIIAFCMGFWAYFDLFNAAQALYNLMPGSLKNFGFALAIVLLLVITILGAIFGMDGLKWISNLSIPVTIVLFIIIYVVSVRQAGGIAGLMAYQPSTQTYTVMTVAQTMVGMWMAGYCGAIDLTQRAKNTRSVIIASVAGSFFVFLCFLVGQVGFIGTGVQTLADICASLGGAIFIIGNISVMVAQGNTTPSAAYMYSNSFGAVFNISRKIFAVIIPIAAAILAFAIMYGPGVNFISVIVDTVSTLVAPLLGVVIADFYIVKRTHLTIVEDGDLPAVCACPMIALLVGVALSFIIQNIPSFPAPTFMSVILTMVIYSNFP